MRLSAGTRLGPYEIVALIGAGGMGEVYRARDTKLNRDVAIKVLPDLLASDQDRLARFTREAQTLASLNHPHIAAIYGLEESGSVRALVIELVEGEDLAQRIARGAIPLDEALPIAKQITEALEAGHELGIIHRDLKPANIKVRSDATVKVLDYGLAKAAERIDDRSANLSMSPTMTSPAMTQAGMILGTAAYMSPEQARGRTADKRTDIWAFGCVLYEMLTGRVAFAGDTVSDTIAAILAREPDWSALPPTTPAPIRRLLSRCVEKDARRRLRDIGDARTELDDVLSNATLTPSTSAIALTPTSDAQMAAVLVRRYRGRLVLATALVLAAVVGSVLLLRPAAPERVRRNSIVPPDGYSFAPLMEGGAPALSPDGTKIAFVAQGRAGRSLWVQSLDAFDAKSLTGTDGAAAPFWSPDSDELAFFADGSLKTVRLDGGAPRVLATGLQFTSQGALPGAWSGDGTVLFYRLQGTTLWRVSSKGGEPTIATELNADAMEADRYGAIFLPDRRHLILLVRRGPEARLEVAVGELGSNVRKPLLTDVTNAQYAPGRNGRSGHLIFVRGGRLIARPFDDTELKLTGSDVTLAEDVAVTLGGGLGDFSVSAGGVLAYRQAAAGPHQDMAWYDRAGKRVGAIGDRRGHPRNIIRFSPSGKSAAFTRQGPVTQEVWIADVESGHSVQLTNNGRTPVWSPDESEIAFLRQDERDKSDPPTYTIYRKKVDGGVEVAVWSGAGILAINDWSGDAQFLLLTIRDTTDPRAALWLLSNPLNPSATHDPVRFGRRAHPQFVPSKGPPLAITSGGIVVEGMPGAKPGPWQVGSGNARLPRWRRDGRELFFHDDGYLQVVERVGSPTDFKFGPPRRLFPLPFGFQIAGGQATPGWDVAPDGQRFLVTNPPFDAPGSIAIVTNWDVE